ncbi:MAG: DUF6516 family protein [Pseudomonadota bacterium]|nr:DUF6516 family protein [Pseudomonadota bacterium]
MDEILAAWHDKVTAHLIAWPLSRHIAIDYAETGGAVAQYRIRVSLLDGSLLQCVERVRAGAGHLETEKYSFHWQTPDGTLICRWDNAPHHRELPGFPHHLHEGDENIVLSHAPLDVFTAMSLVETRLIQKK